MCLTSSTTMTGMHQEILTRIPIWKERMHLRTSGSKCPGRCASNVSSMSREGLIELVAGAKDIVAIANKLQGLLELLIDLTDYILDPDGRKGESSAE